jgi:hypothetical protein
MKQGSFNIMPMTLISFSPRMRTLGISTSFTSFLMAITAEGLELHIKQVGQL